MIKFLLFTVTYDVMKEEMATTIVALKETVEIGRVEVHCLESHALVTNLVVACKYRRRGIATELMHRAEDLAARERLDTVVLSALPHHTPSWALYDKLGYVRAPHLHTNDASIFLHKRI